MYKNAIKQGGGSRHTPPFLRGWLPGASAMSAPGGMDGRTAAGSRAQAFPRVPVRGKRRTHEQGRALGGIRRVRVTTGSRQPRARLIRAKGPGPPLPNAPGR